MVENRRVVPTKANILQELQRQQEERARYRQTHPILGPSAAEISPTYPEGTAPPSQLPAEITIEGQLVSVKWMYDDVVDSLNLPHRIWIPQVPMSVWTPSLVFNVADNYIYELKDIWGKDPTTGVEVKTGEEYAPISQDVMNNINIDKIIQGISYASLGDEYWRRFGSAPTGEAENYLYNMALDMSEKKDAPKEEIWQDLSLLKKYPSYSDTLRRQGKLRPLSPAEEQVRLETEQTTRRGMEYAFQPEGTFTSEKAQAEDTLARLKPMYDQYKQQLEQGVVSEQMPGTVTQQLGVAGVKGYESAQQKLADIQSGKVKGWDISGENPLPGQNITPEERQAARDEAAWQQLRQQAKQQRVAERFTKI